MPDMVQAYWKSTGAKAKREAQEKIARSVAGGRDEGALRNVGRVTQGMVKRRLEK